MTETKPCPACGAPVDACDELVAAHEEAIAERDRRMAASLANSYFDVACEARQRAERAEADVAALQRMDAERFRVLGRWRRIAEAAIRAWRRAKAERDEARRESCFPEETDEEDEQKWGPAEAARLFPE